MKSKVLEFKKMPVLHVCSSRKEASQIVESSKKISRNSDFVLVLNYKWELEKRVLPAYVNAMIRISGGIARSGSAQIEMLLLLCGTMNIGKALRECGMKNSNNFMLFATSMRLLKRFAKMNGIKVSRRIRLEMDPKAAGSVAITELLND